MKEEFGKIHAEYYDYFDTGLINDINFYVEYAEKIGSPILEIGFGTGRILIPTAKKILTVFGIEKSCHMFDIAEKKIVNLEENIRNNIQIFNESMLNFEFDFDFSLITIPYRGFHHMLNQADQVRALLNIREHLTDDGFLIFDTFDAKAEITAKNSAYNNAAFHKNDEFIYPPTGNRILVWDTFSFDPELQMISGYYIFEEIDKEGRVLNKTFSPLKARYFNRYELQYLLELCGFKIVELYGDFYKSKYYYGGQQIWVAQKD